MNKEDIKVYLPYISGLLIVLGALKLQFYYSFFGFNIFSYLDLSEILTLFLNDLIAIIISTSIGFIYAFLMQPVGEHNAVSMYYDLILNEKSNKNRFKMYLKLGFYTYTVLFAYVLVSIVACFVDKSLIYSYVLNLVLLVVMFICRIVIFECRRQWFLKFKVYPKIIYSNIIIILTCCILMIYAYANSESHEVKDTYKGSIIQTKDKTIISNDTVYFIGKTRNYLFLNSAKLQSVTVIPMTEVKEVSLKNSKLHNRSLLNKFIKK